MQFENHMYNQTFWKVSQFSHLTCTVAPLVLSLYAMMFLPSLVNSEILNVLFKNTYINNILNIQWKITTYTMLKFDMFSLKTTCITEHFEKCCHFSHLTHQHSLRGHPSATYPSANLPHFLWMFLSLALIYNFNLTNLSKLNMLLLLSNGTKN